MPTTVGQKSHSSTGNPSSRWRLSVAALLLVAALVRIPLLCVPGFGPDTAQFAWWGHLASTHDLAAVYDPPQVQGWRGRPCNLPPLNVYGFYVAARAFEALTGNQLDTVVDDLLAERSSVDADRARSVLRIPAFAADLVLTAILAVAVGRRTTRRFGLIVAGLYALSPAVLYDSGVWGQIDAVHTLLMVASVWCAVERRWIGLIVLSVLAVLAKAQAIVLAPLWAVAAYQILRGQRLSLRNLPGGIFAGLATAAIVIGPFGVQTSGGLGRTAVSRIVEAYGGAVGFYPRMHLNGFSAWFLGAPMREPHLDDMMRYPRDDLSIFVGLTPRRIGMIAFVMMALMTMMRLLRSPSPDNTRNAAWLLPLAFFVVSTQMHERYLFPCVGLLAFSAAPTLAWAMRFATISAVCFVNMAWAWPSTGPIRDLIRAGIFPTGAMLGCVCAVSLILVLIFSFPMIRKES